MTQGQLSYVYAVGSREAPLDDAAAEVLGQDDSPLRSVTAAGLRALVGSVPGELYGEAGLRAQLEDMERLETVARRHHAVVDAAFRHAGVVLPMRLATLCLDDDRVVGMLRERAGEFGDLLHRLEGRSEWGVKVYVDAAAASRQTVPETEPPGPAAASSSPGRDYLRRRRTQRDSGRRAYRDAESVLARIAQSTEGLAVASVAHRPQQGELATGPGENVANHAYLVDADRGEDFAAALSAAAAASPGVRVEVTGPWAPYSFATPHDA
jgi:hypothetical protein